MAQTTLAAWSADSNVDDIVVVTSVPLLYMGAVPSGMMYRAEKERTLDRYDLGNDTRAFLDLLPPKQTILVAGDIHMYLRSQLCNSATDVCIPQVRRAQSPSVPSVWLALSRTPC